MAKRTIIPPAPKPEEITPKVKQRLESWIDYFKKLSPRIVIKTPYDKGFDFDKLKFLAKEATPEWQRNEPNSVKLDGWPTIDSVAFFVQYNSSRHEQNKIFYAQDSFLFCFGDLAFGLDYFEYYDYDDEIQKYKYHLNYPRDAICWKYIAGLIRNRIDEIEKKSVPPIKT